VSSLPSFSLDDFYSNQWHICCSMHLYTMARGTRSSLSAATHGVVWAECCFILSHCRPSRFVSSVYIKLTYDNAGLLQVIDYILSRLNLLDLLCKRVQSPSFTALSALLTFSTATASDCSSLSLSFQDCHPPKLIAPTPPSL
jgi:hypothetical protein